MPNPSDRKAIPLALYNGNNVSIWGRGDRNDCYTVFTKMVDRGEFLENIEKLIERN